MALSEDTKARLTVAALWSSYAGFFWIVFLVALTAGELIVGRSIDLVSRTEAILLGIILAVPFALTLRSAKWLGGGVAISSIAGCFIGGANVLINFVAYEPQRLFTLPALLALALVLAGVGTWLFNRLRRSRES